LGGTRRRGEWMGDDWVVRANTRKWRRGREGSMSLWEEKEGGKREERGEGKREERGGKEEGGKRREERGRRREGRYPSSKGCESRSVRFGDA